MIGIRRKADELLRAVGFGPRGAKVPMKDGVREAGEAANCGRSDLGRRPEWAEIGDSPEWHGIGTKAIHRSGRSPEILKREKIVNTERGSPGSV